jgi:hypothetical protein
MTGRNLEAALLNYPQTSFVLVKNSIDKIDNRFLYQLPELSIVAFLMACRTDQTCKIAPFHIQEVSMAVLAYI